RELAPGDGRAFLHERIGAARAERGLGVLPESATLSAVAQRHARSVADGAFDGVADAVIADLASISASVAVNVVYDIETLELPEPVSSPDATAVGVGVYQSDSD